MPEDEGEEEEEGTGLEPLDTTEIEELLEQCVEELTLREEEGDE